ncbi:melanoma-associated antigen 8-like [Thomomys bottae]
MEGSRLVGPGYRGSAARGEAPPCACAESQEASATTRAGRGIRVGAPAGPERRSLSSRKQEALERERRHQESQGNHCWSAEGRRWPAYVCQEARLSTDRPTVNTGPAAKRDHRTVHPSACLLCSMRATMPYVPKSQRVKGQGCSQAPREAWGLVGGLVPVVEEEEAATATASTAMLPASPVEEQRGEAEEARATASSSFTTVGLPHTPREEPVPRAQPGIGCQKASLPRTGLVSAPWSQLSQGSRSVVVIPSLFPWTGQVDPRSLLKDGLSLVPLLLLKYHLKEPTSREELLKHVCREHQEFFPMIFKTACECLLLVFGLELQEVVPGGDSYALVTSLGLTYDGLLSDVQGVPKTGLLIMVLCVVFREGNHVSEEVLWEALSKMGVCPGREHYTYGDPRKLVEDFVREQYLECRWVPNSDPARCVYQWGPRALAETSKVKVLEQWVNFTGRDPSSFSSLYKEALRKEKEATQQ